VDSSEPHAFPIPALLDERRQPEPGAPPVQRVAGQAELVRLAARVAYLHGAGDVGSFLADVVAQVDERDVLAASGRRQLADPRPRQRRMQPERMAPGITGALSRRDAGKEQREEHDETRDRPPVRKRSTDKDEKEAEPSWSLAHRTMICV